ncbi:hypothetical protein D3C78_1593120 [compost metagenome]
MGIAGGAGGWMAGDMGIGVLQGIDETESGLLTRLAQVISQCVLDILVGQCSWDDRLGFHPRAFRTRLRSDSK